MFTEQKQKQNEIASNENEFILNRHFLYSDEHRAKYSLLLLKMNRS